MKKGRKLQRFVGYYLLCNYQYVTCIQLVYIFFNATQQEATAHGSRHQRNTDTWNLNGRRTGKGTR